MEAGKFYHIYNHANGSENLFRNDENYNFFLRKWSHHIEPIAESYAYCLMPNHFHFLVRIKDEENLGKLDQTGFQNLSDFLSKKFSNLFVSYAKAYNKMYDRRGSLFNRPFKAKEIENDSYLTNVIFYIHHNPLHHGFTKSIADWEHSSYHAMISNKLTRLKRKEVQSWFGSKNDFKEFHDQAIKGLEKLELEFT